jgi:thiol-disulfide isomerase/thioredoxin
MLRPNLSSYRLTAPALVALFAGSLACGAQVNGSAAAAKPAASTPSAAAAPADSTFKGFHKLGDYVVAVDGAEVPSAEVFQLANPFSFLILTDRLASPVLLSPRQNSVETVPVLKVARRDDGSIDLLADAVFSPAGRFTVTAKGDVSFAIGGHQAELRERQPLLGLKKAAELDAYNPEFGRVAKAYTPSEPIVQRLKAQSTAILITVYFGSWCPHCKEMVPRVMRVGEQLAGSKIEIVYYGLPKDIVSDPKAKELAINSVPTGVVTIGGKEVARIGGNSFKIPELAISNALLEISSAQAKSR